MISVHPRAYERLTREFPQLRDIIVSEISVQQVGAWHAGGTPVEWLTQFEPNTVEWLHTDFIGMDHLPFVGETTVTNGHGTTEDIVAEWILTSVLSACKRFGSYRRWSNRHDQLPILLKDAKVVIVGRGAIGTQAGALVRSVGATHVVITGAHDLSPCEDVDVVVIATSLRDETRGLIENSVIQQWRRGTWLVSISHGGVIVEPDVISNLWSTHLGGAIIDCFEDEPLSPESAYWDLATVSPHLAWYSPESSERRVAHFLKLYEEWTERK